MTNVFATLVASSVLLIYLLYKHKIKKILLLFGLLSILLFSFNVYRVIFDLSHAEFWFKSGVELERLYSVLNYVFGNIIIIIGYLVLRLRARNQSSLVKILEAGLFLSITSKIVFTFISEYSILIERYFLFDAILFLFIMCLQVEKVGVKSLNGLWVLVYFLFTTQLNISPKYHDFDSMFDYAKNNSINNLGYLGENYRWYSFYEKKYNIAIDKINEDIVCKVNEKTSNNIKKYISSGNKYFFIRKNSGCYPNLDKLLKSSDVKSKVVYNKAMLVILKLSFKE